LQSFRTAHPAESLMQIFQFQNQDDKLTLKLAKAAMETAYVRQSLGSMANAVLEFYTFSRISRL